MILVNFESVLTGDGQTLADLKDLMDGLSEARLDWSFEKILTTHSVEFDTLKSSEVYVDAVLLEDGNLYICGTSRVDNPHEVIDALADKLELKHYFLERCSDGNIKKRADFNNSFFPVNWHLEGHSPAGESFNREFRSLSDVFAFLSELTGEKISLLAQVRLLERAWPGQVWDSYLILSEIKRV